MFCKICFILVEMSHEQSISLIFGLKLSFVCNIDLTRDRSSGEYLSDIYGTAPLTILSARN